MKKGKNREFIKKFFAGLIVLILIGSMLLGLITPFI